MTAPAYPNLHRIAYGEGARLTAEARVEAADALERIKRRCDECSHFKRYRTAPESGNCGYWSGAIEVAAHHACNAWQPIPLTPAHDKEKS
ncbi:MAG: hypothetical protein IT456_25590 [Planctomycetes bacterium]|nr:hypothetical protein [Planctomycetota bacterium]